jgi:hypothetical protein
MDYDWLWVILAAGVLAPVGFVPVALARDACAWWREYRRGRRGSEAWSVSYESSHRVEEVTARTVRITTTRTVKLCVANCCGVSVGAVPVGRPLFCRPDPFSAEQKTGRKKRAAGTRSAV